MQYNQRMFLKLRLVHCLALITLLVSGCRHVEETRNPVSTTLADMGATAPVEVRNTSEELSRIQFDDIPVPPGFHFRNHRNESFSFVDGDMRLGRFVYWGREFTPPARQHFLELMTRDPYNWTPRSSSGDDQGGPWILEKNGERCVISSRKFFHDPKEGVILTVSVGKHLNYDDKNPGKRR